MTLLYDLFPAELLRDAREAGYVREQTHAELPLAILNYSERAAYDHAWDLCVRQCRGLIYHRETLEVVARPFPKFFNHGEPDAPELDLDAPAVVTDKMDGSLGILYPLVGGRCPECGGDYADVSGDRPGWACTTLGGCSLGFVPQYAIATRGSFVSEQALHATVVLRERYEGWIPDPDLSYLFEIVFPTNRVVLDYGLTDDLFLLAVIETATGGDVSHDESTWSPLSRSAWPGPRAETHDYPTLAAALEAEPRPNAEGYVVHLPETEERVKIKQADYVALHRILTGTNARDVYEFAAVRACREAILRTCEKRGDEGKHWASFVGLDPARVEQLFAAGDDWLASEGIPDEFYGWVRAVVDACEEQAGQTIMAAIQCARDASEIDDRAERFLYITEHAPSGTATETMRLASGGGRPELDRLLCRAWREAAPAPLAPFQRSEAVA